MKFILNFLMFISSVMVFIPLLPMKKWWVVGLDFLRIQLLFVQIIILFFYFIFINALTLIDYFVLSFFIISFLYQVSIIFPYTLFAKKVVLDANKDDETCLSLLHLNILMGNHHTKSCIDMIKNYHTDIVLLVETDDYWSQHLLTLDTLYPYKISYPKSDTFGMILLSKLPIINGKINFLVKDSVPSLSFQVKLKSGQLVNLICLHPEPPAPTFVAHTNESTAPRDIELSIVGDQLKSKDNPVIVMGDLNDVAWSKTTNAFQKKTNLLDPRKGRGFYNTFHAAHWFVRFPLDHFFHSDHFTLKSLKRLPNIGSDHFPLFLELCLKETVRK